LLEKVTVPLYDRKKTEDSDEERNLQKRVARISSKSSRFETLQTD